MVICEACQAPIDVLARITLDNDQKAYHLYCFCVLISTDEEDEAEVEDEYLPL